MRQGSGGPVKVSGEGEEGRRRKKEEKEEKKEEQEEEKEKEEEEKGWMVNCARGMGMA